MGSGQAREYLPQVGMYICTRRKAKQRGGWFIEENLVASKAKFRCTQPGSFEMGRLCFTTGEARTLEVII